MATAPYLEKGKWYIDKDPDDKRYYVANISKDLQDSATTATAVQAIVQGVSVLEGPVIQGSLIVVKLGGLGPDNAESFCTFRVTCANTEQFDRTIYFKKQEN